MKFSVLMSVYDREKPAYLDQAIRSILEQTLVPNEIVIVEDGPLRDDLHNVINKYKNRFPELFITVRLAKNSGLGLALKAGLKACQYEYVARMDSDDMAVSNRFERQIGYIENHLDVDLIGSAITEYDETMKQVISYRKVPTSHNEIVKGIKRRSPFNHMTVVYRKQVILDSGSYEHCPYFEDYYLWCKLVNNGATLHNLSESLVLARCGTSLIDRRGGVRYLGYVISFQLKIYRLGIINLFEFVTNSAIRGCVALIPIRARLYFYSNVLRRVE